MEKICKKHGLIKFNPYGERRGKKGPSKRYRCSKCAYESVKKRRLVIKKRAVEYKGGCCIRCGYNKALSALEFHHTDPTQKELGISVQPNIAWEKIRIELDKCILVCANCHREIHEELRLEELII